MIVLKFFQREVNVKNKFLFLLLLCGCQVQNDVPNIDLPEPPELKMRPIVWNVNNGDICLSPENYSNLSLNINDLKGFIIYQNKVIKIYKYNNTK